MDHGIRATRIGGGSDAPAKPEPKDETPYRFDDWAAI